MVSWAEQDEVFELGLAAVNPVLDVMGIEHHLIEKDDDVRQIVPAIEKAYANSFPTTILIGREPR